MLGVPQSLGVLGAVLFVAGLLSSVAVVVVVARRRGVSLRSLGLVSGTAVAALIAVGAWAPVTVWRIAEDIRYTRGLDDHERVGAGPIQAFLQPYLLDDAARALPPGATYHAAAGDAVPYPVARQAFPSLALDRFFPRVSRADPRDADWIVAWGVDPQEIAEVVDVQVVTERSGVYPAVVLARVVRSE